MKGFKLAALILFTVLFIFSMAACTEQQDQDDLSIRSFDRQHTNKSQSMNDQRYNMDRNSGDNTHPRPDMAHQPRLIVSQEIADAIAQLDGIDYAGVMLTDRNAYVAVMIDDNSRPYDNQRSNVRVPRSMNTDVDRDLDLGDQMKAQIAETVRLMNPEVENVYVSANPDFVDRFNGIMDHMADGRPLQGLINEFNVLVERIFPENS